MRPLPSPTIHFGRLESLLPHALSPSSPSATSKSSSPSGRCLLLTSHRGKTRASTENKVRQILGTAATRGVELFEFSPQFLAGEPSLDSGVEAMRMINRVKPVHVVALGGGAVMNLAKYACNRNNSPGNIRNLVMVPTVSCAGNETIDSFEAIDWRGNELYRFDDWSPELRDLKRTIVVDETFGEMNEIDSETDFLGTMHSLSYLLDPTGSISTSDRRRTRTSRNKPMTTVEELPAAARACVEHVNNVAGSNRRRWTASERLSSLKCSLEVGEKRRGEDEDESNTLLTAFSRALAPTFPLPISLIRVTLFRALMEERQPNAIKMSFPSSFPGSHDLIAQIEEMLRTRAPEASATELKAMYLPQIDEIVNAMNDALHQREDKAGRLPKTHAEREIVLATRKRWLLKLLGIEAEVRGR